MLNCAYWNNLGMLFAHEVERTLYYHVALVYNITLIMTSCVTRAQMKLGDVVACGHTSGTQ